MAEAACRVFDLDGAIDATEFLQRSETALIVAEDGSDVVGWVYGHELVHPDSEHTMLLYALDVVEHRRREGYGKELVASFVSEANARGCTEVWVLTDTDNDAAVATYMAAGARNEGEQLMLGWRLRDGRHSS